MKKFLILVFICAFFGCEDEDVYHEGFFEFISPYCASVTVGGFVGISEKCFEVGDLVEGTNNGDEVITIRIAEHSERNDGPPSNASYQEFLDVPPNYLRFVE